MGTSSGVVTAAPFDVPGAMEALYSALDAAGWVRPHGHLPEYERGKERVSISHVSRTCEVRYWREWYNARDHAKAFPPYNALFSRPYGDSLEDFAGWLFRLSNHINAGCPADGMAQLLGLKETPKTGH